MTTVFERIYDSASGQITSIRYNETLYEVCSEDHADFLFLRRDDIVIAIQDFGPIDSQDTKVLEVREKLLDNLRDALDEIRTQRASELLDNMEIRRSDTDEMDSEDYDAEEDEDEGEDEDEEEEEEGETHVHHRHSHNHGHNHSHGGCQGKCGQHSHGHQSDTQNEMRKRILEIQRDNSILAADKAKRIQELMTQKWTEKQKQTVVTRVDAAPNKLRNRNGDFSLVTDEDRKPHFHDEANGIFGCKHYRRGAKLQAHCCGKWFPCRFCHDEVSDHSIVRNLTTMMLCMACGHPQAAAQECENCEVQVSRYYCKECKLWDDDPRKSIYHCHDCGICRIGKGLGQDYFHCEKCNVCMAMSLQGRHKCIERNLESDCPICGEYMFTSTTTVIFMPCGHCIHYKCHQEYIQTNYQCPTCFKSLANMSEYFKRIDAMLAKHKMPQEYENWVSYILCNDCEQKCEAKYHFLYHKCGNCESYNTKVIRTGEKAPGSIVPSVVTAVAASSGVMAAEHEAGDPEFSNSVSSSGSLELDSVLNSPSQTSPGEVQAQQQLLMSNLVYNPDNPHGVISTSRQHSRRQTANDNMNLD